MAGADSSLLSHAGFTATRTFGSLNGLRCLSILAVVWHHASVKPRLMPLAANGFLGVDLFFVISGFLITTLLLRERAATGRISLRRFWMRRTLRIFPPYFALLAVFAVALVTVLPEARMRAAFFAELPFLATYTSNWVEITTLFGITWSLATEEQFYLVWPLVERFLARWVMPLLGLFLVVNQALNFGLLDAQVEAVSGLPRASLAVLQTTFTPILLGVALAHALASPAGFARSAAILGARAAAPLALALVIALASVPGDLSGAPRLGIHAAMAALVAACVVREDNGLRRLLTLALVERIGAVSYGIYLYHLVALGIVSRLVPPTSSNPLRFLSCAVASLVLAEISYRVLETRFLRLKGRFEATPRQANVVAGVGRGAVFETVEVGELRLARATPADVVEHVFAGLREGRGGTLVTPNLDILQLCSESAETAALFNGASLSVADGTPVLWLARLAGRPLPARVAGSDLVWLLAERAAREGRSLFLLGGEEGVAPLAQRALEQRYPGLRVVGVAAPRVSSPPTREHLAEVRAALTAAAPDLVYCAFGSPKQERLAADLAGAFPRTWFLGCGAALSFIAGHRSRAPRLVQRLGLEWLHRMLEDPGRLARRYLLRNLPYLVARAVPRALRARSASARS